MAGSQEEFEEAMAILEEHSAPMSEEEVMRQLAEKVRTNKYNVEIAEYIIERKRYLRLPKNERGEFQVREDISDDIVKNASINDQKKRIKKLEDSLTLTSFGEDIIRHVPLHPVNNRSLEVSMERAMKSVVENTLGKGYGNTVDVISPINLPLYYEVLSGSMEDPETIGVVQNYMTAFSEIVAKADVDDMYYYRAIVVNLLNIPVYKEFNIEEGIEETEIYLNAINNVLNNVRNVLLARK